MKLLKVSVLAATILSFSFAAWAQNPAPAHPPANPALAVGSANVPSAAAAAIEKRVEAFFRDVFALGSDTQIQAGPINSSPSPDLYEVPVKFTEKGQTSLGSVFVSKDGRFMFRGQIEDLNADPLAAMRSKIHLEGYASKGPADAKVTVVEFGDLECPSCRQFESVLRTVLPKYPQVRFVFKDFPLESIHPWAKTAAIAAHCVLKQGEGAFWKFHDTIYDNQEQVTVENAFDKLAEYATAAGADPAAYKACLVDPATAEAVTRSQEEGRSLGITGTPTTFVDGRAISGPNQALLEQYIQFDLNRNPASK